MKTANEWWLEPVAFLAMVFGGLSLAVNAQYTDGPLEGGPPPPLPGLGRNGPHPPQSALMQALDVNHDGVIDAREIANASAALRTLDQNGDGKLTPDELRPARSFNLPDPAGDRLMWALDANHDGVIDAHEIANAPAALRKLDRNGDGKLTPDELRPASFTQVDPLAASYNPNDLSKMSCPRQVPIICAESNILQGRLASLTYLDRTQQ